MFLIEILRNLLMCWFCQKLCLINFKYNLPRVNFLQHLSLIDFSQNLLASLITFSHFFLFFFVKGLPLIHFSQDTRL